MLLKLNQDKLRPDRSLGSNVDNPRSSLIGQIAYCVESTARNECRELGSVGTLIDKNGVPDTAFLDLTIENTHKNKKKEVNILKISLTLLWGFISISIPSVGRTAVRLGSIEELATCLVSVGVRTDKESRGDACKSAEEDDQEDDSDSVDNNDNDDDENNDNDDDVNLKDVNDSSVGVW